MNLPLRERIITEAVNITEQLGWSGVTMTALATRVGVSRQTIYTEVGHKQQLAEAVVLNELARFLDVVTLAFDKHAPNLRNSVRAAVVNVLDFAGKNALLRAIVTSTHRSDTELLPLLTTQSEALLTAATSLVTQRITDDCHYDADRARFIPAVSDIVVRTVLSHVMRPAGSSADVAKSLSWAVTELLVPSAAGAHGRGSISSCK